MVKDRGSPFSLEEFKEVGMLLAVNFTALGKVLDDVGHECLGSSLSLLLILSDSTGNLLSGSLGL